MPRGWPRVPQAARVFPCQAPLDQFQQDMVDALRAKGWVPIASQRYDFGMARKGARAWVKLRYAATGVEVVVKAKLPLWKGAWAWDDVWEAAQRAQGAGAGTSVGQPPSDAPPKGF